MNKKFKFDDAELSDGQVFGEEFQSVTNGFK